jgi:hypothetical protein
VLQLALLPNGLEMIGAAKGTAAKAADATWCKSAFPMAMYALGTSSTVIGMRSNLASPYAFVDIVKGIGARVALPSVVGPASLTTRVRMGRPAHARYSRRMTRDQHNVTTLPGIAQFCVGEKNYGPRNICAALRASQASAPAARAMPSSQKPNQPKWSTLPPPQWSSFTPPLTHQMLAQKQTVEIWLVATPTFCLST